MSTEAFEYGFDRAYKGDLATWQMALREKLSRVIGLDRAPAGPLRSVDSISGLSGGRRRTRHLVQADPWPPQPLYEFHPSGQPNGVTLLAFHGHGSEEHFAPGGMYGYIWELARRGYRVVVPILFGKLEREAKGLPYSDARDAMAACAYWSIEADALGVSLLGARLFDALLAYRLACGLPGVDSRRIGCVGLSMGGELAMYLPALLTDIHCSVSAGFLCTFDSGLRKLRTFCQCYSIRGWPQLFDMPDIAGCVAPRPLQIQKGVDDGCIDPADADLAFERLRRVYQEAGVPQNVAYVTYPGGHCLNVNLAEQWFRKHITHDP